MKSIYIDTATVQNLENHMPAWAWLPFAVSLETGLRVGDVVALPRRALKADGIHYRAQKTGKKGVAPVSAQLRTRLRLASGDWLFPSPQKAGCHITRQAVWYRLKKACEIAGVNPQGISPHTMRKVFAVELYREKGFQAVKDALQHSNSATTEIYAFADWSSGANADKPLTRRDISLVVKMVLEALGDVYLPRESVKRRK